MQWANFVSPVAVPVSARPTRLHLSGLDRTRHSVSSESLGLRRMACPESCPGLCWVLHLPSTELSEIFVPSPLEASSPRVGAGRTLQLSAFLSQQPSACVGWLAGPLDARSLSVMDLSAGSWYLSSQFVWEEPCLVLLLAAASYERPSLAPKPVCQVHEWMFTVNLFPVVGAKH